MVLGGAKDAGEATKDQVDGAYRKARLVSVKYKKKIILENIYTDEVSILEDMYTFITYCVYKCNFNFRLF